MEEQNNQTQKVIELVKKSNSFRIFIPEKVEKKIRYMCQHVWKDEWSGTLFYKPEGRFEDGSLVINCEDIYVMDIGSAAYTEFDMSPDVISYMTENPELLDCQMGLIHSHNNMSTFFSGTDVATLKEEGIDRNHFVSLIVNNAGTYTAAITRRLKSTKLVKENFTYPSFEDKEVRDSINYKEEVEELQWFNLNIEFENQEVSLREQLGARLNELRKAKEAKIQKPIYTGGYVPGYGTYPNNPATTQVPKETKIAQSFTGKVGPANIIKKEQELPFDKEDLIPYNEIHFDPDIIKSLTLQLITGSIIIPNSSKIDMVKWSRSMPSLFEGRFGKGEYGLKLFRTWAESHVEFLCMYSIDEHLINDGFADDEIASICAYFLIEELKKLPKNAYIDIYMDILENYLL